MMGLATSPFPEAAHEQPLRGFSKADKAFLIFVALCTAGYMFWLSGYLFVVPGGITAERMNILFNADASVWIERIGRIGKPLWMEVSISHPLRPVLWGIPARGLAFLLSEGRDPAHAAVLAAKSLNAGLFGLGMGALSMLGLRTGLGRIKTALMVMFVCGFSANAVIASTDHFGISYALMMCSVCAALLIRHSRAGFAVQGLFAILIFGTTVTNALVPLLNMLFMLKANHAWDARKYVDRRRLIVSLVLVSIGMMALLAWHRSYQGTSLVVSLLHFRLLWDPWSALQYAIAALTYPVVAPGPMLGEHGITLEPIQWTGWTAAYAMTMALWLAILMGTVRAEWKRRSPSPIFWIALPWLGFNIIFHNLWGDEYFLFSPHWSWLFAFVLLLRLRAPCAWRRMFLLIPVAVFQAIFLMRVHSLLAV